MNTPHMTLALTVPALLVTAMAMAAAEQPPAPPAADAATATTLPAAAAAVATAAATQPAVVAAAANVPPQVVGNWVEGSVSPTTFWDIRTGQFQGSARGMGQYMTFSPDGTYKQYVYLETRMYNMVTRVWTQHEGTIAFTADTFTIRPTRGHYKAAGTHKIDRPMSEKELADKVKTYKWRLEQDPTRGQVLVLPFDDGSAFRLRRTE